jgi:hypothetical protein
MYFGITLSTFRSNVLLQSSEENSKSSENKYSYSEMRISLYKTTRRYIPEDTRSTLHNHWRGNLNYC